MGHDLLLRSSHRFAVVAVGNRRMLIGRPGVIVFRGRRMRCGRSFPIQSDLDRPSHGAVSRTGRSDPSSSNLDIYLRANGRGPRANARQLES